MPKDFDWFSDDAKQDVVIPSVQATAVYVNGDMDIVIRQQHPMGEEDAIIIIPRAQAKALAKAITDAAKPFQNIKSDTL
jgi:hypothetical protein